jgi:hypothetical protein
VRNVQSGALNTEARMEQESRPTRPIPKKTFRVLTLYVAEDLLAKSKAQAEPAPVKEHQFNATRATGTRLR